MYMYHKQLRMHFKWALSLHLCKISSGEHPGPSLTSFVRLPPLFPDTYICPPPQNSKYSPDCMFCIVNFLFILIIDLKHMLEKEKVGI